MLAEYRLVLMSLGAAAILCAVLAAFFDPSARHSLPYRRGQSMTSVLEPEDMSPTLGAFRPSQGQASVQLRSRVCREMTASIAPTPGFDYRSRPTHP